jgi:hypothetical protein
MSTGDLETDYPFKAGFPKAEKQRSLVSIGIRPFDWIGEERLPSPDAEIRVCRSIICSDSVGA